MGRAKAIRRGVVRAFVRVASRLPGLARFVAARRVVTFAEWARRIPPEDMTVDETEGVYACVAEAQTAFRQRCQLHVDGGSAEGNCEEELYAHGLEYTLPEQFMVHVPGGRVLGRRCLVLTSDGAVFRDSLKTQREFDESNVEYRLRLPRISKLPGGHILLAMKWARGYYHWLFDALARLSIVEEFPALRSLPLIVPKELHHGLLDAFDLLGISHERLVPIDRRAQIQVDRLFYPSPLNGDTSLSPKAVAWLRRRLYQAHREDGPASRRLYVTRRDARRRRILNEDELVACLRSYGFETYCPGDSSLLQQIRTFAQASFIVGPHGGGMSNLVFAPKSARVIELFPSDRIHWCYWNLASIIGQSYGCVAGPVERDQNFVVPVERVECMLRSAGM